MVRSSLDGSFEVAVAGSPLDFALMFSELCPSGLMFFVSPRNEKSIISILESVQRTFAHPHHPAQHREPRCVFLLCDRSLKSQLSATAPLTPIEPSRFAALSDTLHCEFFSLSLPIQAATIAAMRSALEHLTLIASSQRERPPHTNAFDMDRVSIIGASVKIRELISQIRSHAKDSGPVLIVGETGTGKELAARALHFWGTHGVGPFIALNCSAIPEPLFESEVFGTERGAYTDAQPRTGAIEEAHLGTLFLDEIGSLSPLLQPRLLRVLETGEYRRLGSTAPHSSAFRLVSASSLNPIDLAAEDKFRKDLLFRIANAVIEIPPLRERIEDVSLLARHFCAQYSKGKCGLDRRALDKLSAHDWPGNVRELKSVIERACASSKNGVVHPDDIVFLAGISKLSSGTR